MMTYDGYRTNNFINGKVTVISATLVLERT